MSQTQRNFYGLNGPLTEFDLAIICYQCIGSGWLENELNASFDALVKFKRPLTKEWLN